MRKIWIPLCVAGLLPLTAVSAQGTQVRHGLNEPDPSSDPDARSERRQHRQSASGTERAPTDSQARAVSRQQADGGDDVDRQGRGERAGRGDHATLNSGSEPSARQVEATEPVASIRQRRTGRWTETDSFRRSVRDTAEIRNNGTDSPRNMTNQDWRRDVVGRRDWSRDWRRDNRYDWSGYRNSHRSIYRLGRYYDPYGWGYRRFAVGYSLRPYYYRSRYWLDDPWMYRLPPAYGPYRWVRYYDDALLVDIHSGFVVDVIHNFFW